MAYALAKVPVAPLRAGANHRTEMVSQLLLCEAGTVIDESKDFVKLQCVHDGYEGWCQRAQLLFVDKWEKPSPDEDVVLTAGIANKIMINNSPAYVPMGIIIPSNSPLDLYVEQAETTIALKTKPTAAAIEYRASQFLNTSYQWGGRTGFGIDCSGFAQMVYRFFGIQLLRDAWMQATQGEVVGFLQEVQCGDLAFFDDAEGKITHVGIMLNDHSIIHSSGNVRIDKIDTAGIINVDTGLRTHQLRIIKRYM